MHDRNRFNVLRSAQRSTAKPVAAPSQAAAVASAAPVGHRKTHSKKQHLIAAIALLAVLIGIVCWWKMSSGSLSPRADRYQVVFLNGGQAFFGKLRNTRGQYLRLDNPYTEQKQASPDNATEEQKKALENNTTLVKVKDLKYGPEDFMMIKSDNVMFWQDLKSDSKVAKAIED